MNIIKSIVFFIITVVFMSCTPTKEESIKNITNPNKETTAEIINNIDTYVVSVVDNNIYFLCTDSTTNRLTVCAKAKFITSEYLLIPIYVLVLLIVPLFIFLLLISTFLLARNFKP